LISIVFEKHMNPTLTFANQSITVPLLFEDSYHVPNFTEHFLNIDNNAMFNTLTATTAPWTDPSDDEMKYRGHELPRQKALWTATHDPLHKYSYPRWQLSYRPFAHTPIIRHLVDTVQRDLRIENQTVVINHVIGTRYRNHAQQSHHLALLWRDARDAYLQEWRREEL
jgi:hypothetical protein